MNGLHGDATAQGWLIGAFNLLTLDDLWTRQLNADHMSPREMQDVASVGESLLDAWRRLTHKGALRQIEVYVHAHAQRAFEAFMLAELPNHVVRPSPFGISQAATQSIQGLSSDSVSESATLESKIRNLRDSVWTPGDLDQRARCRVLFLSMIVAFALSLPDVGKGLGAWFLVSPCASLFFESPSGGG